jgi:hypothetical protein
MQYRNNVRYEGVYGGIAVTFTLQNFSKQTVERFNETLAKEVAKNVAEARQSNVVYG